MNELEMERARVKRLETLAVIHVSLLIAVAVVFLWHRQSERERPDRPSVEVVP